MQRTEGQKPEEAEQEQPPKFPVEVAVLSLESLSFSPASGAGADGRDRMSAPESAEVGCERPALSMIRVGGELVNEGCWGSCEGTARVPNLSSSPRARTAAGGMRSRTPSLSARRRNPKDGTPP